MPGNDRDNRVAAIDSQLPKTGTPRLRFIAWFRIFWVTKLSTIFAIFRPTCQAVAIAVLHPRRPR
ncbi:hypothetical protein FYK55_17125 [Roseiconus nitratireducens]|uniref:Uncharacterized protein n=1 Tax=Roseiconus nitratireducens TaxID=2605748 RepID=A0A5M6D340_9BACT|nr:hypothetical protein FYK55_17125 [Roseiconus nitratireducens]